jgi:hypothetical protein
MSQSYSFKCIQNKSIYEYCSFLNYNVRDSVTKEIHEQNELSSIVGKLKCYYCNEANFPTDLDRIKHIDIEHPGTHHPKATTQLLLVMADSSNSLASSPE